MDEKKEKFQNGCATHLTKLSINLKDILENLKILFFFFNL